MSVSETSSVYKQKLRPRESLSTTSLQSHGAVVH